MLYFIFCRPHAYTLNSFLADYGWGTARRFELIDYSRLLRRSRLPVGSYVFADIERLSTEDLERAGRVWRTLASSGRKVRLLNHPLQSMRRYELLRTLYTAGINHFNVYRLTERRQPGRFPVFIRVADDHKRAETPLLHTQDELEEAVEGLTAAGKTREGRIITEYCFPAKDRKGYYRKYGAFVVAGEIIPAHIIFGDSWVVQAPKAPFDAYMIGEIENYLRDDAHVERLRQVAALAHIDFGRIDYTVVEGQIQVFEINTNPSYPRIDPSDPPDRLRQNRMVNGKILSALLAIDSPEPKGDTIALETDPEPWYWKHRNLPYDAIYAATRVPVLRRFGPSLFRQTKKLAKKTFLRVKKDLLRQKLVNP